MHGNSAASERPQHVYEILRTDAHGNTDVYKYGVSGDRVNASGGSARAERQVSALNRASGGQYTYRSSIVADIPAGPGARAKALALERFLVYQHRDMTGAKPPGNIRP